jgi:hypothetical protein
MDEVRVWDHARTAIELSIGINTMYTSYTGLAGCWRAEDDATLFTAADSSGSGNPAVIVGSAIGTDPSPISMHTII